MEMKNRDMPGLGRGERAPDFVLPLQDGTPTRFYARAGGRPAVLLFCDADEMGELLLFSEALAAGGSGGVAILAVKRADAEVNPQARAHDPLPFPVFLDVEGKVRTAYRLGAEARTAIFVLDPNLRVLAPLLLEDAEASARKVTSIIEASLPQVEPLVIATQAPVLLIPNILDPVMCKDLIDVWQNEGSVETGVEQSSGGRRKDTISPDLKRRRDHIVTDKALLQRLTSTIGRRVMPEIEISFAFRATRFEGFKIACYDAAAGGFFDAHRDNLSPATAHRRFALTLNLNEDYEGGYLRFPEYGPHLYRQKTGCGVVFSCSHLHEVTAVTKGRRFALLSFLFREGDMRASRSKPAVKPPSAP